MAEIYIAAARLPPDCWFQKPTGPATPTGEG
jgi:hypothetical protein